MSLAIAAARSFLFVPADRPERFAKAQASGADAVIIDLEDAVGDADKARARASLATHWAGLERRERVLIRINELDTRYGADDVALCLALAPTAVVVPKARAASLGLLAGALPATGFMPLIETATALGELDAIARHARTLRLALGHLDLQADLGMQCGEEEAELAPARFALVVASRAAGRAPPVDGVTLETTDEARVLAATVRARRFGFTARLCIHPRQVPAIHAGFAPTQAELDWARRVLAALDGAEDGGAIQVDGRMVDRPVVLIAQRLVERYGSSTGLQRPSRMTRETP